MKQLFYITLDPERALGVEDLLPSYHILYSELNQLTIPIADKGINIKNIVPSAENKIRCTADILRHPATHTYVKEVAHGQPNILVFKNDGNIAKLAHTYNYTLLNPPYELNSKFENKIEFANYLKARNISQPDYVIYDKFGDVDYQTIASRFGREFVVQFMFGYSGNSTFFISDESQLKALQAQYPLRKCKVSRKINGPTYTVNACVIRLGVVVGGISEQITGIPELTSSAGGTVGNDFSQRHLNDTLRSYLVDQTMLFGELLRKEGYRGMFGLDFILDMQTQSFYLIEANIRQVASATYVSYLQRIHQVVPIMLWHILELLDVDYSTHLDLLDQEAEEWINNGISVFRLSNDRFGWNLHNNQPMQASQILFRNIKDYTVQVIEQFPTGIYRMRGRHPEDASLLENDDQYMAVYRLREDGWSTLCLLARGYNIIQARNLNGFLVLTKPEKAIVEPLGEIGRIQVLEPAFGSVTDKYPSGWIMDVIRCIYENMRFMKFMEA
ncbi:MAG: hypothetical protein KatS3mg084_0064 [Candidatus Dojkabacteria bacterium]|nr:MAG: hypothetical protein KatS3mg084_0064 [Candidatus Dojkabacteria bacterium]